MKLIKTVSFVVALTVAASATAQLSITRMDVNKGGNPSLTTAFIAKDGTEVWVFGADRADTQDVELGHLYPLGKKWLVGGYGAYWPGSKKVFALPFVLYHDTVLGGQLTLKLGDYLPLNGGPTILFSDESSLLWRARKGMSWGPILSLSKVRDDKPTVKLGLSLHLSRGRTDLELGCQPVYLSGGGAPHFRIAVSQGF